MADGPHRTCVGCRAVRPATELVRFTRRADGTVLADRFGPGRGAWCCADRPDCVELAWKRNGFARTLRAPVRRPDPPAR